jgi:ribosomal protein L29
MFNKEGLKALDKKGLDNKLAELRLQIFNFKMQKKTMGLDKPHLLKNARREVARGLTHKSLLKG